MLPIARRPLYLRTFFAAITLLTLPFGSVAHAQTWDPVYFYFWHVPENWDSNSVPTNGAVFITGICEVLTYPNESGEYFSSFTYGSLHLNGGGLVVRGHPTEEHVPSPSLTGGSINLSNGSTLEVGNRSHLTSTSVHIDSSSFARVASSSLWSNSGLLKLESGISSGAVFEVGSNSEFEGADLSVGTNIISSTDTPVFRVMGLNAKASTSDLALVGIGTSHLARGAVEVTSGGRWDYSTAVIGEGARGDLTITSGTVAGSGLTVAQLSSSLGFVTMSGSGSLLSASSLIVGGAGDAEITVNAGTSLTVAGSTIIGQSEGSDSLLHVSGSPSSFTTGSLVVGDGGYGTLDLGSGATASWTSLTLGRLADSGGTLHVPVNSTLNLSSDPTVGESGYGMINFRTSGASSTTILESTGTFIMAKSAGAFAEITVPANGEIRSNDLRVGLEGSAYLTIEGTVKVSEHLYIAGQSASLGAGEGEESGIEVSGATGSLIVEKDLVVGRNGTGSLSIFDGGNVVTRGTATIAYGPQSSDSHSQVTVSGADSLWTIGVTNSVGLTVGESIFGGRAELTITDGGRVVVESGHVLVNSPDSSTTSTIRVSGPDSALELLGFLFASLRVGDSNGRGRLLIQDGGRVQSGGGVISGASGTTGFVRVTGAGSVWDLSNSLEIARFGNTSGVLEVEDDGLVEITGALGVARDGGVGEVIVDNGTITITSILDTSFHTGSDSVVQIFGTGSIAMDKDAILSGGVLSMSGGLLQARKISIPTTKTVSLSAGTSGIITLTGGITSTVDGKLKLATVEDGFVIGTGRGNIELTNSSRFTIPGTLEVVFSSTSPTFGPLTVTGSGEVDVAGGEIKVSSITSTITGFNPDVSYSWPVIATNGTITLSGTNSVTLDTSAFTVPYTGTFSLFSTDQVLYLGYAPVPEPATVLGLAASALMTARLWRRRQIVRRNSASLAGN